MNLIVESDEKRIKQVLINLQSNALKFTKDGGKIMIICEYVQPKGKQRQRHRGLYDVDFSSNSSSSGSNSSSENSETANFNKEHTIKNIIEPHPENSKLVISVIDSGIGIKKEDRVKLFKLFGCL
jgi:signal transduction histidine kinase